MSVPHGRGTHGSCKTLLGVTTASLWRLLGRGSLVDDLHTAVHVRRRVAGVLELRLAVSHGHKVGPGNAELIGQIALDRVCTPLGQVLIVSVAADRVGMACDDEGRAFQLGVGQRLPQRLNRGQGFFADIGRIVIEVDFKIDIRFVLGDGGDFFALGG